ncbi:hypothetical protein J6TS2_02110 [Heyndrickxia sporothermodurans]|nr:hypothetical protein J6TS2_02110 [Heyndrickxia sporothermodurans]
MFRKTVLKYLIVFLLFLLGGLLYFQWHGYSTEKKHIKTKKVDQNITIEHHKDYFKIEQTIQLTDNGVHEIVLPENAKNFQCFDGEKQECKWNNHRKKEINIHNGPVKFQYELETKRTNSSFLLNNWSIKLKNYSTNRTKIQLIDRQLKNGTWIIPSNKVTMKRKKYINYLVYDVNGQVPPLFWHKNGLNHIEVNSRLMLYYQKSFNIKKVDFSNLEKLNNQQDFVIVLTEDFPQTILPTLLIMNQNNTDIIEKNIIKMILKDQYSFKKNEEWMVDIISSVIFGKGIGTSKAQYMYSELQHNLSEEQLNQWSEEVLNTENNFITSTLLDKVIEDVTGNRTDFFVENRQYELPNRSFILYDSRKIIVFKEEKKDLHTFNIHGKKVLPLSGLAKAIGYKIDINQKTESIIMHKKNNKYHFHFGKKTFTYNGEKYGIYANPFVKYDGNYYIEINWLQHLFNLKVDEDHRVFRIH